jgi:hypothetical protein
MEIETWDELREYLLERMDCFKESSPMVKNSSLTKKQYWDSQMSECLKYSGERLPVRTKNILLKRVKRNFGLIYTKDDV